MGSQLTMVTEDSFLIWKKNRLLVKNDLFEKELKSKKDAVSRLKIGMKSGIRLSGKDMFDFNPDLLVDDGLDDDVMDLQLTESVEPSVEQEEQVDEPSVDEPSVEEQEESMQEDMDRVDSRMQLDSISSSMTGLDLE